MTTRIGVAAIIYHGNHVLLGQRKGSHGEGTWSFPGGHLEPGESPMEAAVRETLEETGILSVRMAPMGFTYDVFDDRAYVTLFFVSHLMGERPTPQILEPEKCSAWEWVLRSDLPYRNLFLPIKNLFTSYGGLP